jgi:phosphatidylethanolamine/phosphatidyl-N-methylethanolamine N-methyltransferase
MRPLSAARRHVRDQRAFLRAWIRSPAKVGALMPSGRFLTRKIASQVDPHAPGWVIEIGAGTGVVTRALLRAGVKPERLLVIERERRMAEMLQREFPHLRIVRGDAQRLDELLREHNVHKVSAVVSSLPLLTMPKELQEAIVAQMFAVLPPKGTLVQFTYGPRSPIARAYCKHHQAQAHRVGQVWLNIPPATVWRYEKNR